MRQLTFKELLKKIGYIDSYSFIDYIDDRNLLSREFPDVKITDVPEMEKISDPLARLFVYLVDQHNEKLLSSTQMENKNE